MAESSRRKKKSANKKLSTGILNLVQAIWRPFVTWLIDVMLSLNFSTFHLLEYLDTRCTLPFSAATWSAAMLITYKLSETVFWTTWGFPRGIRRNAASASYSLSFRSFPGLGLSLKCIFCCSFYVPQY